MSGGNDLERLAKLVLAGQDEAYGQIYERTVKDVYRTVYYLVGNRADTEDIVQDSYLQFHRSLRLYDPSRPLRPWLMGVVMRQVRSYRRGRWMQFRFSGRSERLHDRREEDFSGEVVDHLTNRALLEGVSRLSFKLQQVITLHYLSEYTQEEIAEILDIPVGTVKSRIHAGLSKLRKQYKTHEMNGKVGELHEI
ncbi:sigma-70 family RNA polymerase sigma factor [Paenibacillus daejeonensis]|uniref:sigma-70 family RNA polymerase sigma factor n=1 Tax=Paenibacillus daejeonensis TaxID=135193 RepID=UPI000380325A|nr:sigma-70 family RNA polymerase sigma factor [Paenibacillus daejeonensis]